MGDEAGPGAAHTVRRTAAVVYNPTKVDAAELRRVVGEEADSVGWAPSMWLTTEIDDPGQRATRAAVAAGVDLVIAVGGDGTVRAVAEGLRGSGLPLGLVPSGTGNLLARNLALTLNDLRGAVSVAFTGIDRSIDLGMVRMEQDGQVSQHAFLVMAGLGIDARMIDDTDDTLKKRLGWLAYAKAISAALRENAPLTGRYRLDAGPSRRLRASTLMIGNCGLLPAGILLLPDAAVDDGLFELAMLRPSSLWGWIEIGATVFWTNGVVRRFANPNRPPARTREVRAIHYRLGQRIDIRLQEPRRFELDGDRFGRVTALRAWIEADGLIVRVLPPISPGSGVPAPTERR